MQCRVRVVESRPCKFISAETIFNKTKLGSTFTYWSPFSVNECLSELNYVLSVSANPVEVLTGDVSIDILKSNRDSNLYMHLLLGNGYKQSLHALTRVFATRASCLGHILMICCR